MHQLLTFLEQNFLYLKKYKIADFVWPLIVTPMLIVIDIILRGKYINLVNFYHKLIPYFLILFLGMIAVSLFVSLGYWLGYSFLNSEFIRDVYLFNKLEYFLSVILFSLIKYSIRILIVYVPISLYFGLELKYLFFAYLSLFLIVPFAMSLGLLISTIILRFKRDAEPLT